MAAFAIAAVGLVLVATAKYGAGLSPDSVGYIDAARNLLAKKGLVLHTGEPLVWWPPLYPLLLAAVSFATRLDPVVIAHFVNAALFAFVIYLSVRLLRTGVRRSATYTLLCMCAVLFARPFSEVYAMAWSECLFIPLVLLYLIFAQRYWGSGDMLSIAVMTLATALACLTRYVGIALVPAGLVTITLASGARLRERLARACVFAAVSLAPIGLWAVRNHQLTRTFFGNRGPIQKSLAENAAAGVKSMFTWYVPWYGIGLTVAAVVAAAVVVLVLSRTVRKRFIDGLRVVLSGYQPVLLFLVAYFAVMLTAAARDATIESRTLSPVYVPVTLILIELGSSLFGPPQTRMSVLASKAPAVVLALWLCFPLASTVRSAVLYSTRGAGGCSTQRWRESETVAYARDRLSTNDAVHVYSNGSDVLWALAGVSASPAPRKTYFGSRTQANTLGDLMGRWPPEGEAYLVWFSGRGEHSFSVVELREVANIAEVAHLGDGAIYRVSVRQAIARDSSARGDAYPRQPQPGVSQGE
ncbi:hypothetical protein JXD38_10430 [candidate division WOR-3 bacterium]|nr:hypothetical protein [candidate division WOR-3 bacterium]